MIRNFYQKYRSGLRILIENAGFRIAGSEITFLHNMMIGLFISLLGYLISGAFLSAFYYPQFWHLSALMTAMYLICEKAKDNIFVIPNEQLTDITK
jgi:hypothetical protein